MPLLGSAISSQIISISGFTGKSLKTMTDAIGNGFTNHLKAGIVATQDTGTVPGIGVGIGTIIGLTPTAFENQIRNSLPFDGEGFPSLAKAIAQATVSHILSAALVTTNNVPVFVGTGVGTISGLNSSLLSNMIFSATGFNGEQWKEMCDGLAQAFCTYIQSNAQVTVTITGTPTSTTTVPGTGAGTGTIA